MSTDNSRWIGTQLKELKANIKSDMGLEEAAFGIFAGSANGLRGSRAGTAGRQFAKSIDIRIFSITILTKLIFITDSIRSKESLRL